MKTVYKYQIPIYDCFELELPVGAQVLSANTQFGMPCLWALVDPNQTQMKKRKFRFAGTGHPITEENLSFVSTFQMRGGALIFHLFEIMVD